MFKESNHSLKFCYTLKSKYAIFQKYDQNLQMLKMWNLNDLCFHHFLKQISCFKTNFLKKQHLKPCSHVSVARRRLECGQLLATEKTMEWANLGKHNWKWEKSSDPPKQSHIISLGL